MRKTTTITYPATPARTVQMSADPAYQETWALRVGLSNVSMDVARRGQGFVATITGSTQPSQLLSVASRFVRSAMAFSVAESWGEPRDDGSCFGGYDVTIRNALVRVSATSTTFPASEATIATVDVDLKVVVSLTGKTAEEEAMDMVGRVVTDGEHRVAAWLVEYRFAFHHAPITHGSCTDH